MPEENNHRIPEWGARLREEVAELRADIRVVGRDIGEIKGMLEKGNDKFEKIEERINCLETDKKMATRMATGLAWLAATISAMAAAWTALRNLI